LGLLQFCEQGLTDEERILMLRRRVTSLLLSCCWLGASLLVPRASRGSDSSSLGAVSERTRRFFESLPKSNVAEGAGGTSSLRGLEAIDEAWSKLRDGGWQTEPSKIVLEHGDAQLPLGENDEIFDVAVAGGTLGIFYAAALQNRGVKCVVIERGKVKGRDQEWNISAKELETLVRLGILNNEELKGVISVEFNPLRVGFNTDTSSEETKTFNMFVKDVLNLGVDPARLIDLVKGNFVSAGGVVMEEAALQRIDVYKNCASLSLGGPGNDQKRIQAKLVLDCMGNGSPIGKQVRGAVEPDGICIVVGTCARGFLPQNNTYGDLIYTDTPITQFSSSKGQIFWEAFPTGSSPSDRTTYMFTYLDARKERPSVAELFDVYWELLPRYQGKSADDLELLRILYGLFPTYRSSPLKTTLDRVLQVGDASGVQSPLSFGGFGSLTRHLERICNGVVDALGGDESDGLCSAEFLGLINAYQPNLSAAWMFQRAMSVPVGRDPAPGLVVGTLSNSFSSMEKLGDATMRPFLQDVLQFAPLLRTLAKAAAQDPLTPFKIVPHVGVFAMVDFLYHFSAMAIYTALHDVLGKCVVPKLLDSQSWSLSKQQRFRLLRAAESWKYGSGMDYGDH
jgi:flavin-dependent dehydrogenase